MSDGSIVIDTRIDQAGADQGISDLKGKMDKLGSSMVGAGKGMSAAVTAPLIAVAGIALKTVADQETAFGKMRAQLGLTGEESKQYEGIAKDMWKNAFGENIGDVTEAISTVKTNIQELNDADLQKVTEGAFALQDVFGVEISESTSTASVMMKNFGIEATDAMDLMTVGMQKGGDFSGELLGTMSEYAPVFSTMGHSAEDMMNILISGAEAGAFNLDKVGDSMKEFNIRAKDGSDATAEGFEAIGLNAADMGTAIAEGGEKGEKAFQATIAGLAGMEDETARNAAGVQLFGATWEDLESDVITAMTSSTNHVEGFEGATKRAGDAAYDTFGSRLTTVFRSAQDALEPVGHILLDFAEKWLPPIIEAVQRLAEWFGKLSPAMQMGAVIFGVIAAAIGPVLIVVGMLIGAIGNMMPVILKAWSLLSKLAPVFKAIRTAMMILSGPIGIISALVIGLSILIYKNWDEVKAKTIEIFTAVKEWLITTWTTIKTWLVETIAALVVGAIEKWQSMKEQTAKLFTAIAAFISAVWNGIKTFFTVVINAIVNFVKQRFENLKTNTTNLFNAVKDFITNVWNGIKSFFNTVITAIVDFVKQRFENLKNNVTNVFNAVKSFVMSVWNGIKSFFNTVVTAIVDFVKQRFETLKSNITGIFNAVKSFITNIWNGIKSTISNIVEGIKNAVRDKFQALKDAVSDKMNSVRDTIKDIWGTVMDFLGGIDLMQMGRDIIQGLIDGVKDMAGNLVDSVKGVVDGAIEGAKNLLGIKSPSRVFMQIGDDTGKGMEIGLDQSAKGVESAGKNMASAAIPGFKDLASSYISGSALGSLKAVGQSGASNTQNHNTQTSVVQHNTVTIQAKDIKDFNSVVELFNQLPQTVRQY